MYQHLLSAAAYRYTTITSHECSPDLLCMVEEICALLKSLDTKNASGHDRISAHMLTSTADAISTSVTNLFNTYWNVTSAISYIREHLTAFHSLSNCQWGFQPSKSTVSALLDTTHQWLQHLQIGVEIGAVVFAFRKVFDSVPHSPYVTCDWLGS